MRTLCTKEELGSLSDYTRTEAMEAGVLVDITSAARLAGFKYPVAVSSEVYAQCVRTDADATWMTETARAVSLVKSLMDWMEYRGASSVIHFEHFHQHDFDDCDQVSLRGCFYLGDHDEIVVAVTQDGSDDCFW